MPDPERPLFEELLDYVLYAPIGAISQLADKVPAFVEEGRQRFGSRLNAARITGRFAVATARRRVEDYLGGDLGGDADPTAPAASAPDPAPAPARQPEPGVDPVDLAIAGYDSLAASQVVNRLAGLSAAERAAIRSYEERNRRRRTILGRIAQLDGDAEGD